MSSNGPEVAPKARHHPQYGTFTFLAILLPLIGLILGIIYVARNSSADRKLGEHSISLSILAGLIWGIIFVIWHPWHLTTPKLSVPSSNDTYSASTVSTHTQEPADIGSSVTIGGLVVTALEVIDPALPEYPYPAAADGKRYVAVKLKIVNESGAVQEGNVNLNVSMVNSDGQNATLAFTQISDCTNFSYGNYTLSRGADVVGCVYFETPVGTSPTRIQFEDGLSGRLGEWNVQ